MNPQPGNDQAAPSTLGVSDILFTVFRHKWKILIGAILGVGAAAGIWFTKKELFESNARILVKYVSDTKSAMDAGQANIQSPDIRGNNVLNSEVAILTSRDSILAAAREVTPQRILAAYDGGTNLNDAAGVVAKNFEAGVGRNSSVIELALRHPDAQVAQDVLISLIRHYQRRHLEVHRAGAAFAELQQQSELLRTRLLQTEAELRRQKNAVGVIDIVQAKQDVASQISTLRQAIFEAEASLVQSRAQAVSRNVGVLVPSGIESRESATNAGANLLSGALPERIENDRVGSTNDSPAQPSALDLARYEVLGQKLAALKAAELDLVLQYKEGSKKVLQHRDQIAEVERSLQELGIDPAKVAPRVAAPAPVRVSNFDSEAVVANIRGLEARLQSLTNQLARLRQEAERIDASEDLILQTERKKSLEEAQYTYYAKSLEQARLDQELDATKLNNISILQQPTAGAPAADKKSMKLAGGALAGGLGLGLGLAFLLDLILDSSVKRRKDLEAGVQLPVFVAIPDFGRNGHSRLKTSLASGAVQASSETWMNGEIPPWEEADPMLPYYEALRDRVVMSYGDDPHKPKIVGLTSCDEHAGVTRLATGLAAALSRDVDRNVLFIGLSKGKVAVSAFAKGRPAEALGASRTEHTLESGGSNDILEENLYSLATTGRNLAGASIAQSFSDLMPKLKVSDYDYVIFDLPPMSQTSGSVRLASQLERTLLVVDSEKTSKSKVRNVKAQLLKSKTQLATIINKVRNYGPMNAECEL